MKPAVTGTIFQQNGVLTASSATLNIQTEVGNTYGATNVGTVISSIFDPHGVLVTKGSSQATVLPMSTATVMTTVQLDNVELWDITQPSMYTLVTTIQNATGDITDEYTTPFGVRKVVFDVNQGLLLNDNPVKAKGFCNHQDFAGVGTAVPDRINEFRVTKLQEMGTNAW